MVSVWLAVIVEKGHILNLGQTYGLTRYKTNLIGPNMPLLQALPPSHTRSVMALLTFGFIKNPKKLYALLLVLSGPAGPYCKKVVKMAIFRPHFKVDLRNGPLMPGIRTGAVLCRFISTGCQDILAEFS